MDNETKELIRTEFLAFAMKAFATLNKGRSLGYDKYLELLALELTRVGAGETKRLVVSMPPRHCKTFMGSICLPAWTLAHNPSAKIVILTYGQDLADKTAYAIRNILRSEWFEQAFHTRLKKDRAKLMDFVTTDGGGVRSLSIDGGVGDVWNRKKGELLRPDAFTKRDIRRLRESKQPGFETLQQQNPGGSDRLRLKAKYFASFQSAELEMRELPVVLSIDPGQKGGPTNAAV